MNTEAEFYEKHKEMVKIITAISLFFLCMLFVVLGCLHLLGIRPADLSTAWAYVSTISLGLNMIALGVYLIVKFIGFIVYIMSADKRVAEALNKGLT